MKVWIENPFDNLPAEGFRPQRYWLMADAFAKAGCNVTLWTSDFSHAKKAPRELAHVHAPFSLKLIKTPPYKTNISLARIRSHRAYSKNWLAAARAEAKSSGAPDIVIISLPPLSTVDSALALKREFGCKIVVDVMDAWPETFLRLIPKSFRFLAPLALSPLSRMANRAYSQADLVTGVCDAYGKIALARGAKSYLRFYHGISPTNPKPRTTNCESRIALVYAGNFGRGYDLTTAIRAVKEMDGATLDIAGAGEREAEWRACAADSPRIRFHGYLDSDKLDSLLDSATVGIIPLADETFVALPYKLGDYASHGLKMVTSLRGECAAIIDRHNAGAVYTAGDVESFKSAVAKAMSMKYDGAGLLAELDAERIYSDYVSLVMRSA